MQCDTVHDEELKLQESEEAKASTAGSAKAWEKWQKQPLQKIPRPAICSSPNQSWQAGQTCMWVEDFAPGARNIRRGGPRVQGRPGSRLAAHCHSGRLDGTYLIPLTKQTA